MSKNKIEDGTDNFIIQGELRRLMLSSSPNDIRAIEEAGLIDEQGAEFLISAKNALGADYVKNPTVQRIIQKAHSESARLAIQENNLSLASHLIGRKTKKQNLSSYHKAKKLQDWLSYDGRLLQFQGNPDTGKTGFALFCAELWLEANPNGRLLTNMESVGKGKTVKTLNELEEEAERDGKWFMIIEDASNHLSGYSVDSDRVETRLRLFKNRLAKLEGVMALLGHTGKDIHADLRRNAYRVTKTSKKRAVFHSTDDRGRKDKEIMTYNGIPQSSINYDSQEITEFHIEAKDDSPDISEKEKIRKAIKKKLKDSSTVKTVEIPFNNSKVANEMRKISKEMDNARFFENNSPKEIRKKVI